MQEPGVASLLPLDGSVVQRLQRFGTYSHLKQIVLRIITHEINGKDDERKTSLDQLRYAMRLHGKCFDDSAGLSGTLSVWLKFAYACTLSDLVFQTAESRHASACMQGDVRAHG